ncbi:MAG: ribonuclease G [Armatimonadaceae bacterium]
MSKEIIVNTDTRESRIAVREDGQLVEIHIEREERVVGNIYKARVESVHSGIDAAFVDIGLDRNAYLSATDILPASDDDGDNGDSPSHDRRGRRPRPRIPIAGLVKKGQELLVQVIKGSRGSKGARVSTRISLPGRYLVFMPDEASTGISRKIDEPKERDRLKRIVETIRKPGSDGKPQYGLIVRTEAEGKSERELRQDLEFLERTWADIRQRATTTPAPNLVYADLSLLFRILRDTFGQDVDQLILDSAQDYRRAHELLDFFGPTLKDRVHLYDGEKPIFEHYGIEQEIERLLGRRVWLKSGGYLVIDQAEALVAIDVNSGRFTGSGSGVSDTIVQTNLEAVAEIARQLRLRDMGGILVLDLIDMNNAGDRRRVEQALDTALKYDKSRCKVGHISPLGLVEMTRKRTGEAVTEQMSEPCPYCSGTGKVASAESVAIEIERDLRRLARVQANAEAFVVKCHPLVAAQLVGENGEDIETLEHSLQRGVYVRVSEELHQEKYEIQPGKMDDQDRRYSSYRTGQVVEVHVMRGGLLTAPAATGFTENGFLVELPQGARFSGQSIRARLTRVGRSVGQAEPMNKGGDSADAGSSSSGSNSGGRSSRNESSRNDSRGDSGSDNRGSGSSGSNRGGRRRKGGRSRSSSTN